MKQIYTLVRPVLGYDESETTFAAFFTEVEANAAKNEILSLWRKILEEFSSLGERPEFYLEGEGWETYKAWSDKKCAIIKKFGDQWKFNCGELYLQDVICGDSPDVYIEVRAVPLYSTVETYK